jgi:hypothetical protein
MTAIGSILRVITGLIIAGLLVSAIFYKYQATTKQNQLDAAHIENGALHSSIDRLQKTIQKMSDFRKADQETFAKLLDNQSHILMQSAVTTAAIVKLRAKNATVDKYLSEPVPVPLRELLNSLCQQQGTADCANGNSNSKAASKANGKLRH